jgi:hypothetical protein
VALFAFLPAWDYLKTNFTLFGDGENGKAFSPFSFFGPVKVNLVETRVTGELELDLAIRIVAVGRRAYNPRDKREASLSTEEVSQMNHER